MPYTSIDEAKGAKFPVVIGGTPLTLAQVNALAEAYDALKKAGEVDDPMAVAVAAFKKAHVVEDGAWTAVKKEMAAEADALPTETEPKVVFKPGKWNGKRYAVADCVEMVENFNALKDSYLPALTLGHDMKQQLAKALGLTKEADGWPRIGDVVKLWWDKAEQAVFAVFANMTTKLREMVRDGRFPNVSLVLVDGVDDNGVRRKNVVVQAGLLGDDAPGMLDQPDEVALAFSARVLPAWRVDSAVMLTAQDDGGESMVDEKKDDGAVLAQLQELWGIAEAKTQDEAVAYFKGLVKKVAEYKAELDEATTKLNALTEKERETRVEAVADKAVKEGRIAPLSLNAVKAFALTLDAERVRKFKVGDAEKDGTALDEFLTLISEATPRVKFTEGTNDAEHATDKAAEAKAEWKDERTPEEKVAHAKLGISDEMWKEFGPQARA